MRTEEFLEGYNQCRENILGILKESISNDEKLQQLQHLAEFQYYPDDGQDKWLVCEQCDKLSRQASIGGFFDHCNAFHLAIINVQSCPKKNNSTKKT